MCVTSATQVSARRCIRSSASTPVLPVYFRPEHCRCSGLFLVVGMVDAEWGHVVKRNYAALRSRFHDMTPGGADTLLGGEAGAGVVKPRPYKLCRGAAEGAPG